MATRSTIGMKNEKGEIKAVYCHWDGYPEYVGRTLVANYFTAEKIEELLALGDLSSLGERVKPNENEVHSYDNPVQDVTVAYHRDRGEELQEARTFKTIDEVIEYFDWNEYYYIFEDGEWYVYYCDGTKNLVEDLLLEQEEK